MDEENRPEQTLEAHLKIYFPQMVPLVWDLGSPWSALCGALAHAGIAAKGATGHLAEFFSQASHSQGGADRKPPDQSHREAMPR